MNPAGVINVGYKSDISPLVLPFNRVVLPAKALTNIVNMKATMFMLCRKIDFFHNIICSIQRSSIYEFSQPLRFLSVWSFQILISLKDITNKAIRRKNIMNALSDFFNSFYELVFSNVHKIVFSAIAIIIIYVVYRLLTRQISRLKEQRRLEENIAFIFKRIFQWLSILIILAVVFAQFGIEIGIVAGLLALAGGTIIGFAAMSTIGNAIAGIIVMISRPFKIGDRILFKNQFADVIAIDLIYTRMKTLDNVLISIPNQELLTTEIDNYGKKTIVRRSCSITAGYELDPERVETALLKAARKVDEVLKEPKPYVWITNFGDFAVGYTLYVFVNQIKRLPEIDAKLKRTVLETCKSLKIDISTPRLIQRVDSQNNEID